MDFDERFKENLVHNTLCWLQKYYSWGLAYQAIYAVIKKLSLVHSVLHHARTGSF